MLPIPTDIPFDSLSGVDLEECLYWLAVAMGGKEVEWRRGSVGAGASDRSRDIEATFFVPAPDGEMLRQKWWIEAKGRTATVEPSAVREAVNNSQARSDVDILVVATNSVFSNPTRDWVQEWQSIHQRPTVRLWDRNSLERMLSERPEVVLRLFSNALTPQAKLAFATSRFWNYCGYTDVRSLQIFWGAGADLEFDALTMFAILASEFANGQIEERPWAASLSDERIEKLFDLGVTNAIAFYLRGAQIGTDLNPYADALAHIFMLLQIRLSPDQVARTIARYWLPGSDVGTSKYFRDQVMRPVVGRAFDAVYSVCVANCSRVTNLDRERMSSAEIQSYWNRFRPRPFEPPKPEADSNARELIFEKYDEMCELGFARGRDIQCPLVATDPGEDDLDKVVRIGHTVLHRRLPIDLQPRN